MLTDLNPDRIYDTLFPLDPLDDNVSESLELDESGNPVSKPDADEYIKSDPPFVEDNDEMIGAEIDLPNNGEIMGGTIASRKRDAEGNLIWKKNENTILDTRMCIVEFEDGSFQEDSTNILMENLYDQSDDDGHSLLLLKQICDYRSSSEAIEVSIGFYKTVNGSTRRVITTKGWQLKVQWANHTESWVPLVDLKQSNPLDVARYVE